MTDRTEAARTACLMTGMADHIGADLGAALADGRLSQDEHMAMVAQCRDCTKPDACILWMIDHDHAEAAPDYCLNGERLGTLR